MNDPVIAAGEWYQNVLIATANVLGQAGQDPAVAAVVIRALAQQGWTLERMTERLQVTHQ